MIDFPRIYSRGDWHAKLPNRGMTRQASPYECFVHHSVTPNARSINKLLEQFAAIRLIQRAHMNNGWSDIGYHFIVTQFIGDREEARIFRARNTEFVPAAQERHNTGTIAICVLGDGRKDYMCRNTRYAIEQIIAAYPSIETVGGHRDVVATQCPGDNFYASLGRIASAADVKLYA